MLEPEDEKIGKGSAGIVDLISDYVERKPQGEAPGPGAADEGQAEDPEDGRQFIRVEKEEEPLINMFISSPKKIFKREVTIAKKIKIFKEVVKVDKYPGEETG